MKSEEIRRDNMLTEDKIQWHFNDIITFDRDNWKPLIAKFDCSKKWLAIPAQCTTKSFRADIQKLAQKYGAKEITLQYMYFDDAGEKPSINLQKDLVGFIEHDNGSYEFIRELKVPDGTRRKFINFSEDEVFKGITRDKSADEIFFITVYRDEIEPHGNDLNLVQIPVKKFELTNFIKENDGRALEDFLNSYTADETTGLVNFLRYKDKLVIPEDVLYTRALIDITIEASKLVPSYISNRTHINNKEYLIHLSDADILYTLQEDLIKNLPSDKKDIFEKYAYALSKHIIPDRQENTPEFLSGKCVVDGVAITIDDNLKKVTASEIREYLKYVKEQASKNITLENLSVKADKNGTVAIDYTLKPVPFNRIRRITGYLVGDTSRWNNAKKSELNDRVKHTGISR